MYVCLCKGITDGQIKAAIEHGAENLRQVRESLGIMTQCGKCACLTKDIVQGCLDKVSQVEFHSAV